MHIHLQISTKNLNTEKKMLKYSIDFLLSSYLTFPSCCLPFFLFKCFAHAWIYFNPRNELVPDFTSYFTRERETKRYQNRNEIREATSIICATDVCSTDTFVRKIYVTFFAKYSIRPIEPFHTLEKMGICD